MLKSALTQISFVSSCRAFGTSYTQFHLSSGKSKVQATGIRQSTCGGRSSADRNDFLVLFAPQLIKNTAHKELGSLKTGSLRLS